MNLKNTTITDTAYEVEVANSDEDLSKVQRLRYDVFVTELGGDGPAVDHVRRLERDQYDVHATHLILRDLRRRAEQNVVGVYRLMDVLAANAAGQFYCEDEYDLAPLRASGERLLELGRACLHPDYRGGTALLHLWQALSDYVMSHQIDVLFGVASFRGTDLLAKSAQLSLLYHRYRAPERYRVSAIGPTATAMNLLPPDDIDRAQAMRDMPPLIKAYLRLGGVVGDGAFIDHAFNTTDICMILPTASVANAKRQRLGMGPTPRG